MWEEVWPLDEHPSGNWARGPHQRSGIGKTMGVFLMDYGRSTGVLMGVGRSMGVLRMCGGRIAGVLMGVAMNVLIGVGSVEEVLTNADRSMGVLLVGVG